MAGELGDGLVIDFTNGDLVLDCARREDLSLVESSPMKKPYLERYQNQSLDYVVVNLQMAWLDFNELLTEVRRVLRADGVVVFSSLSPDTLGEVGYAWAQVDDQPHVHPFVDMHFVGDALSRLGFAQPIVDTDWLTVQYESVDLLLCDLKGEGFVNLLEGRRRTLTGKNRFNRFCHILEQNFTRNGSIEINFEVVFGFARAPDLNAPVRVQVPSFQG